VCGHGVRADEDGCCAHCGADCKLVECEVTIHAADPPHPKGRLVRTPGVLACSYCGCHFYKKGPDGAILCEKCGEITAEPDGFDDPPRPEPVPVKAHDPAIERAKEVAREDLSLLFRVADQRRQRIEPTPVTEAQAALSLVCQHLPAHDGDELDNAVGVLERLVRTLPTH
jgi:hypothetical protein